uniref:Putative secreted protein n=1 Tax=Anopheles darlingi TaxID=43151 RepID=A0A2M4DQ38_ANODA
MSMSVCSACTFLALSCLLPAWLAGGAAAAAIEARVCVRLCGRTMAAVAALAASPGYLCNDEVTRDLHDIFQ